MSKNTRDRLADASLDDIDAVLDQRSRAVRRVASVARDATDLLTLLDALGLSPQEGRRPVPGSGHSP